MDPSKLLWASGISLGTEGSYRQSNRALHGRKSPGTLTHDTLRSNFHDVRLFSEPSTSCPRKEALGYSYWKPDFVLQSLFSLALPVFFTPWVSDLAGCNHRLAHLPMPLTPSEIHGFLHFLPSLCISFTLVRSTPPVGSSAACSFLLPPSSE